MPAEKYLELLKSTLLNEPYLDLEAQLLFSVLCAAEGRVMGLNDFWAVRKDKELLSALKQAKQQGDTVVIETGNDGGPPTAKGNLRNFTEYGLTLVGRRRLDHLQHCVETILADDVPGDFLEAGVWRGGCCILMRGILDAHDCRDRKVWVCDSFQGIPQSQAPADRSFPMDSSRLPFLAISQEEVADNFSKFGLLDEQVVFVPGWFSESLPTLPLNRLALLRIDADLYSSTMDVLQSLYPKVSAGGWVVIDDYHVLPPCRQAVEDFRADNVISAPIEPIDEQAVCWRVD